MSELETIFDEIESDFQNYVECFLDVEEDPEYRRLLELKREHSDSVCKLAKKVAQSEGFDNQTILLCQVAGLLHDIGRFEQINVFGTLDDLKSVDHGDLGFDVLSNTGFLEYFTTPEQLALLFAVKNHNKRTIHEFPNELTANISKVVRDADKLDVYRVMHVSLQETEPEHHNSVLLGLEENENISAEVAEAIEKQHIVNKSHLKTSTDFHLMQMSWVFDLNFKSSFQNIQHSEYFQHLSNRLPENNQTNSLKNIINQYITKNI